MLKYRMVVNRLTREPSYRADVLQTTVSQDVIISEMNMLMPVLDTETLQSVIEVFKNVILTKLSDGNSVLLPNFIKISPSITGRFELPTDSATIDNVQFNANVSSSFEQQVKADLSLTKQPYIEKSPSISSVMDATGYTNYLGELLTIRGSNLSFNQDGNREGVSMTNTYSEDKTIFTIFASITDTRIIFLASELMSSVENYNEYTLEVATRYTQNGSLRTAVYAIPLRRMLEITDNGVDEHPIMQSWMEN
jgi:hypothetical protein